MALIRLFIDGSFYRGTGGWGAYWETPDEEVECGGVFSENIPNSVVAEIYAIGMGVEAMGRMGDLMPDDTVHIYSDCLTAIEYIRAPRRNPAGIRKRPGRKWLHLHADWVKDIIAKWEIKVEMIKVKAHVRLDRNPSPEELANRRADLRARRLVREMIASRKNGA